MEFVPVAFIEAVASRLNRDDFSNLMAVGRHFTRTLSTFGKQCVFFEISDAFDRNFRAQFKNYVSGMEMHEYNLRNCFEMCISLSGHESKLSQEKMDLIDRVRPFASNIKLKICTSALDAKTVSFLEMIDFTEVKSSPVGYSTAPDIVKMCIEKGTLRQAHLGNMSAAGHMDLVAQLLLQPLLKNLSLTRCCRPSFSCDLANQDFCSAPAMRKFCDFLLDHKELVKDKTISISKVREGCLQQLKQFIHVFSVQTKGYGAVIRC